MLNTRSLAATLAALAALSLSSAISAAQEVTLPGNASSLRESHGDWQVACATKQGAVRCAMSQTQLRGQDRQRVLTVELSSSGDGNALKGLMVMPFGLSLDDGVILTLDDNAELPSRSFSTCLPAGCLVPLAFDPETAAALRSGKVLKVNATADGGDDLVLSVSLKGFSSAYDRVLSLME